MTQKTVRIGVVAPASRIEPALAEATIALARAAYPDRTPDIVFDPQCYLAHGHFAGDDAARAAAFLKVANDPAFDALWIARGGYGSARLIASVVPRLTDTARRKTYLGYSDAAALLGALYGAGCTAVAHGPMPADLNRDGGPVAVRRALSFLVDGAPDALEPHVTAHGLTVAFNITILSHLIGTPWQPELAGHVLMLEEVSEHMYRIDRALGQITANPAIRKVAGIRLGRCSLVAPNDPDFGQTEEDVCRHWCAVSGIPYLGRADIGHDINNRVVPFGRVAAAAR